MNRFVNMETLVHSAALKLTARALLWFLCESTVSTCFVLTLSIVGLRMWCSHSDYSKHKLLLLLLPLLLP